MDAGKPGRRAQDHWQSDIEGRIGNLSEGMGELLDRMNEQDAYVHEIKHDLANNTMVTNSTAKSVRELKASVDEAATNSAAAMEIMRNLKALDRIAQLAGIALKKAVPVVALISAAVVSIKAMWK